MRLYQNFAGGQTDAALTNSGTTLSSPALAGLVAVASPDFAMLVLDPDGIGGAPEIVEVSTHSSSATTAAMIRGQEGTVARAHESGVTWILAGLASDLRARAHKHVTSTSGNITANSSTFAALAGQTGGPGTTGFDLAVAARIGDVLAVGVSLHVAASTTRLFLDAATIVSASPVNYVSGTSGGSSTEGVQAWSIPADTNVRATAGGVVHYEVVSGDLSGGTVTVRPMFRTDGSETVSANSNTPFHFNVHNIGPKAT